MFRTSRYPACMAIEKHASRLNLLASLAQRFWGWGSALWVLLPSISFGGIVTYIAAITEWLKPWGPIVWPVAFIFGCAIFLVIFYIFTVIQERRIKNAF